MQLIKREELFVLWEEEGQDNGLVWDESQVYEVLPGAELLLRPLHEEESEGECPVGAGGNGMN